MGSINDWATFFGWCTLINVGFYFLTVISLLVARDLVVRFNTRIFALAEEDVRREAFRYVGNYKLALTLFCFVPWLALTLMS